MLEPQHHAGNMDAEDRWAMRGRVGGFVHALPSDVAMVTASAPSSDLSL